MSERNPGGGEKMEALLYLVGLSSYMNPEIEKSRHHLVNELRHKLHTSTLAPKRKELLPDVVNITLAPDNTASLVRLAEDSKTAPYILAKLAEHDNHEVRMAVADNDRAPYSAHRSLAQDPHDDVRYRVAENYHIRPDLLRMLMDDENPYVAVRAESTLARIQQA